MADLLREKTEEELWKEYKETRNPEIRESFIKQYAPLVKYVAGRVAVGMPQNVEFDDLVGYGVFGLIDAIDKFDPDKHVKFKTYAVTRIRGSIFDELRSMDWVPRSVRQKAKEIEATIQNLESILGRTPSDMEIASEMKMNMEEYNKYVYKISGTSILSLNDVWYTGDDNDKVSIVESIESPASLQPDVIVEKEEIKRVIKESIQELPEKQKHVLVLYYYEKLNLKEIGKILGVTESRISQMHTSAILKLRAKLTNIKKGIY